ncbi:MAG: hypothetical protein GTO45_16255, partial [Candidatus Aminicenantes bacterium]|nr:hypothetical protein [Candidatus Aminicenantes bacterium]NIM80348.1 hypothetical protein [Candidatus Aminicenantes bacterium]NIN19679.1 hypothetical protein [Candidatus Aminicenantes bacterium]NIN43561.1 hypothetical protein [Candidatus Aminicenantes bacterium]NIN86306.1 hypothetical protein [Candidatus Aminicenantes bacterium]
SAFVPILPLRNYPSGGKTFDRFLEEVHRKVAAADENRYYPIETLPEPSGTGPMGPGTRESETLYDTLLAVQTKKMNRDDGVLSDAQLAELKAMPYGYEPWHSPVKLAFTAVEAADRLFFSVLYRRRLFKEETIRRYFAYFREIIAAVLDNIHISLNDINISYTFLEPDSTLLREADGDFGF